MSKKVAKSYKPTARESASLEANRLRRRSGRPRPRIKVENEEPGQVSISPDHEDSSLASSLLRETFGTQSHDFFCGILLQLAALNKSNGEVSEADLNFMLAGINGIKPRDETEAMLAAQMTAIHVATMKVARHLANADTIPKQDSAQNALSKLARTYASQMETLKKYRTGGQQKMTVEHIHVHQGGQAIVGNVATGEGAAKK